MEKVEIDAEITKQLNRELARVKNAKNWYKVKITEKNKIIKFSKSTFKILQNSGVNVEKTYYNYNDERVIYNLLEKVFTNNKETFYYKEWID